MTEKEFNPEKRLFDLTLKLFKKIFLIFIAILTYYQFYEYIIEKTPINIEIANSTKHSGLYETVFIFNNSNSAIEKNDMTKPIEITLSKNVQKIIINKKNQEAIPKFKIEKNRIFFEFDLLNKNEKIFFKTLSKDELIIKRLDFRIKDIDKINFYHYIQKPKPLKRLTNFWLVVFGLSLVFFIDALLLILKDRKLTEMKYFVRDYPLNEKNKYDFLEKYRQLYNAYKVRFKLSEEYLINFKIKNLLDMYNPYTTEDVAFIKFMINKNTEFSIFYRLRTIFIIISPILILTSITGIVLNYFYYDFIFFNNYSLNKLNIALLSIVLLVSIMMILFPRKTMNTLFIKEKNSARF